jgi:carboxypeptidase Taq
MDVYDKLLKKSKELYEFGTGLNVLRWDLQTHMPPKGMKQRSAQLALMSKLLHRMSTDGELEDLVTKLEKESDKLEVEQKREVELIRRSLDRRSKIPEDLVAAETAQRTVTVSAWKKAKEKNNWKLFESEFVTLLDISRTIAEIIMEGIGAKFQLDALMDTWEPRMTTKSVNTVFKVLRKQLIPRVKKYSSACADVRTDFKKHKVPASIQQDLLTDLTGVMGYDTTSENAGGRIDESEHPFTIGYYDDIRITTNYIENDFLKSMFGGLHETGHALYRQNLNPDWKWMYLGDTCSSGISESQARFIENTIGRSSDFWKFYFPQFVKNTNGIFTDITCTEFLQAINIVKPSKIRVMADEMTYALHIIIRFEIEQDLFNDKIDVSEIPAIWNAKYEKYLGVEIETDTEGALQDIHWSWAFWGYFPMYALGDLYAAMIREKMTSDMPEWSRELAEGNVAKPTQWLMENVHRKSNLYDPSEIIKKITGKSLTADPFIDYLDEKYSSLFG